MLIFLNRYCVPKSDHARSASHTAFFIDHPSPFPFFLYLPARPLDGLLHPIGFGYDKTKISKLGRVELMARLCYRF
jgi:hypothetical protein